MIFSIIMSALPFAPTPIGRGGFGRRGPFFWRFFFLRDSIIERVAKATLSSGSAKGSVCWLKRKSMLVMVRAIQMSAGGVLIRRGCLRRDPATTRISIGIAISRNMPPLLLHNTCRTPAKKGAGSARPTIHSQHSRTGSLRMATSVESHPGQRSRLDRSA